MTNLFFFFPHKFGIKNTLTEDMFEKKKKQNKIKIKINAHSFSLSSKSTRERKKNIMKNYLLIFDF